MWLHRGYPILLLPSQLYQYDRPRDRWLYARNISMHASIDSFISPSTSPMGKHKLGSAAFENLKPLEEARHNNNA
ncbi:Fluconazole resistance protein 1 [Fusarium oxysporum f. sp. albedinis]|nr:Fluconazole resistance protein 1 [Fusarium oxysporum f. sp. albedinis]